MEIPSTQWLEDPVERVDAHLTAPISAVWKELPGLVRHTFTHFHLELIILSGTLNITESEAEDCIWVKPSDFKDHALPTLMKKVCEHALIKLEK